MVYKVPQYDFMSVRKIAGAISLILVIASVVSLATRHLALGLDFTGGALVEVSFEQAVDLPALRQQLQSDGISDAVVQFFGTNTDVVVRVPPQGDKNKASLADQIFASIKGFDSAAVLQRNEYVGPQVGDELRDESGLAMLVALGLMLLYVTLRFTNKFAVGAVAALFHDVLIVLGIFSFFRLQFDLTVLAAVLAIIGYSLNDTIVVADRIRENFRAERRPDPVKLINDSINQTLSRTIRTSLTTLLVLVALFLLGGEMIHNFATALILGVLVGTYSSVYVASNVLLAMGVKKEDFIVPESQPEQDGMP